MGEHGAMRSMAPYVEHTLFREDFALDWTRRRPRLLGGQRTWTGSFGDIDTSRAKYSGDFLLNRERSL